MVIHSFPGIGKFTIETIKAYEEVGMLYLMLTTIVIHPDNRLVKVIKAIFPKSEKLFKQRYFGEILQKKIKLYPFKELLRLFSVRFFSLTTTDKIWEWGEISYDKWAANQLDKKTKIVHAYEHAALASFERAQKLGIFKILEQTSQHYSSFDELILSQFEKYPSLRSSYYNRINEFSINRNNRKRREHDLADLIICNSSFTKKTLIKGNVAEHKIIIVPLAFPKTMNKIIKPKNNDVLSFLYAGSLSVTKGTHILIEVWNKHFGNDPKLKLILVGKNILPKSTTEHISNNITILDFIPQSELNKLYDLSDVLVFPTLGDGFGMVITEAMARGLPVIASKNSAGPELIDHELDGLLINAGDTDDLTAKIQWCINNKPALTQLGINAQLKAKSYQWEHYRENLIRQISLRTNLDV